MMKATIGALIAVGMLATLPCADAMAATTVLDPGAGTDYLSVWCGGQTVNEIATGFDAAGNAVTEVTVGTTCNGSGRGSPSQHYLACWSVSFGEDGKLLSKVWQATNHWVQGNPAVPCPVSADATAVYTFADGAGNYPATLSTQSVGTTVTSYRAVLETTCTPIHVGDTVSGTINAAGDIACYSFSGSAADSVRVTTVTTSGTLQAGQEILGPDGAVLCSAALGSLDCTLAASGRQIILASDYYGTGTGGYDLSLACLTPSCQTFDYALSNSGAVTVAPGASGTDSITATLTSGLPESVSLAASGLPAGASASFDVAGCSPTCTTQMTILTDASVETGTFPITVTGSPLGRSTMFTLTISSGTGPCPAKTALASAPDQAGTLTLLHDLRDQVLSSTPSGRRLVRLYYRHAAEGVWLMLRDPGLRSASLTAIEHFLPAIQALVAGQQVALAPGDAASIDSLLQSFAVNATPGMRADINTLRQRLRQGSVFRDLGIVVR